MSKFRTKAPQGLFALLAALILMLALPVAGSPFVLSAFAEDEMPADESDEDKPEGDEEEEEVEEPKAHLPWVNDIEAAKKQAKAEGKDLFINFTGSDWCRYCKMLDAEVFEHAEFVDSATKDFVFLFLDFPNDPDLKTKVVDPVLNDELKDAYGVGGYPTIILATADGHPYGRTGYQPGGPEPYLAQIEELQANGEKVKTFLADEKHENVEALKAAFPVLAENELLGYAPYGWTLDAIEKLDPKGELELLPYVEVERERRLAGEEHEGLQALMPKSRDEKPDIEAISKYVIGTKYLSGPQFLNLCLNLVGFALNQGGDLELAKQVLERAGKDPLAQEHPQAKTVLEQLNKRVDDALNPPADEDEGEGEGEDPEDGDEDEDEHDADGMK